MKKIISAILALSMSAAMITSVMADDDITVTVNGNKLYFEDTAPFIENERTLVPMRAIFEALGADVDWDGESRTVYACDDETSTEIILPIDSDTMIVNNGVVRLEVSAKIVGASTVIPLRAVAESMNCDVDWNGDTRTVTINRKRVGVSHIYTAGSTLTIGTNAAFPPFEYVTENGLVGEFDGIDIAIAKKIAEDNDMKLAIKDMEYDGLGAAANLDRIDMVIAGMPVADARKEYLDFSDIYYVSKPVILVRNNNIDIHSADDILNTKKVGVILGSVADVKLFELGINENNIIRVYNPQYIIDDLVDERLDAVVIDSIVGTYLTKKYGLKIIEDQSAFETEEFVVAVKKGNTDLLNIINKTITEMKETGEIEALAVEYVMKDI